MYDVIAKDEVILNLDDALTRIADALKHLDFDECLLVKPFLVLDHFHGHVMMPFVIVHFECLAEGTLPQSIDHLVAVGNVIVLNKHEISATELSVSQKLPIVIVLGHLLCFLTDKVDGPVLDYFFHLDGS